MFIHTSPIIVVGCKILHDKLYNDTSHFEKLCNKPKSFISSSSKIGELEIVGESCWRSEEQRAYYVGVVFRKEYL